ncbi:hypothetical protein FQA39_LY18128 [Lamprigera yunnana]|nr:hypothetical protein FQA39_LY18128 [Lamprigera yunnana]
MVLRKLIILLLLSLIECVEVFPTFYHLKPKVSDEVQKNAVKNLLLRLVPNDADKFLIEINSNLLQDQKEMFRVEKLKNNSVHISATTGVTAATGFHHYLKYYCMGHISWEISNLKLPKYLPHVNITITAKDKFRYYQNVCTTSYSFVWWSWSDWEKHIDWMVLNSYNLVLSFSGLETIWNRVYNKLGMTEKEIDQHFTGPAFLSWGRMGNIKKWGGPLPESWKMQSVDLQHQILNRMRSFGILPILPAFAGHVPVAFKRLFPNAKLTSTPTWNKFQDEYCCPFLLEPTEPLFRTVGNMFMKELIGEFGTNHIYSCDTFNEMLPSNGSVTYLRNMGQSIYSALTSKDSDAIWIMQNWMFVHEIVFWTEERVKALLTSVPQGKMIILDLQSEQHPQYKRFNSYYGQPYIWCMLHNFGGTLGMFGSIYAINNKVHEARHIENGTMVGTGLTPEGINQNYVVYDFMSESSWRSNPINLTEWFSLYSIRRYGQYDSNADSAWQILKDSVYNFDLLLPMRGKYVLTRRPSINIVPWIWYDFCDLMQAWNYFLKADALSKSAGYLHDVVDVTRQVLQVLIDKYYKVIKKSYKLKNLEAFQNASENFLDIFLDLEKILRSNRAFLLGNWLNSAKRAASNGYEEELYEYNARNQITLWGPNGEIVDYASKQWSGMISDYYYKRWSLFLNALNMSLINNIPINQTGIIIDLFKNVEEPFTFSRKTFSEDPLGDSVAIAQEISEKWFNKSHCRFVRDNLFSFKMFYNKVKYPTVIVV